MRSVKDREVSCISSIPACDYDNSVPLVWTAPGIPRKRELLTWSLTLGWRATWVSTEPTECAVVSPGLSERPRLQGYQLQALLLRWRPGSGCASPTKFRTQVVSAFPLRSLRTLEVQSSSKGTSPFKLASISFTSFWPWPRAQSSGLSVLDGSWMTTAFGRMGITVGPRPATSMGSYSKESGQLLGSWRKSVRRLYA